MENFVAIFRDLRSDMKGLIVALQTLNREFGTLKKAIESIDRLQATMERNEGLLRSLVKEMEEMNQNVSTLMKVAEALKE